MQKCKQQKRLLSFLVFFSMKKHVNIPIFIPHMGCPNQCVFCNQRTISGVERFDIKDVRLQIDNALRTVSVGTDVEIAFFGGSFTGIDRSLMISLLEIAYEYVACERVSSVRCSTRPDYIDNEILDILKKHGVKTIELGLQSYDDEVLSLTKRGHTSKDAERACRMIVEHGFSLVGQMMIGLPGSTLETEIATAKFIVSSGAIGARIYPTVVFKDTDLAYMAEKNLYVPLNIEEAVARSSKVLDIFVKNKVKIIRIGLCASDNLADESKYYAGPNHPALGEMVEGEMYYCIISDLIANLSPINDNILTVLVANGALSKAIGQKKINKQRLISKFGLTDIKFREDPSLIGYDVKLEEGKRKCI